MRIKSEKLFFLVGGLVISMMGACSSIPMPEQPSALGKGAPLTLSADGDARQFRVTGDIKIDKVVVEMPNWPADESVAQKDEVKEVVSKFRSQLSEFVRPTSPNDGLTITVKSTITDGRTVSTGLNVFTTAILFVPVDRGGAVVEIEALDQAGKTVAAMMYRHSGEITEFTSNFSKTAQIQVATKRASERFASLLNGN
jgi:Protein of unknown function (DUF3313)